MAVLPTLTNCFWCGIDYVWSNYAYENLLNIETIQFTNTLLGQKHCYAAHLASYSIKASTAWVFRSRVPNPRFPRTELCPSMTVRQMYSLPRTAASNFWKPSIRWASQLFNCKTTTTPWLKIQRPSPVVLYIGKYHRVYYWLIELLASSPRAIQGRLPTNFECWHARLLGSRCRFVIHSGYALPLIVGLVFVGYDNWRSAARSFRKCLPELKTCFQSTPKKSAFPVL